MATLSNFPVLFTEDNLPSEMFDADGANPAQNGGGDIRFSSDEAGTTELAFEIVDFTTNNNPALGTAQIWVKVPSLDDTTDTTIYVWYGHSTATAYDADETYGSQNVWRTEYKSVWHVEETGDGTAGEYKDSTVNAHNAQGGGGTAGRIPSVDSSGAIENAQTFDGSNDWIDTNESSDYNPGTGNFSAGVWFKTSRTTAQTNSEMSAMMKLHNADPYPGWKLSMAMPGGGGTTGKVFANVRDASTNKATVFSSSTYNDGAWYHYWMVRNGDDLYTYINGVQVGTIDGCSSINATNATDMRIGTNVIDTNDMWDGSLDEIRYYAGILTADWLVTEYNNQSDPSSFATAGTPVDPNASGPPTGTLGMMGIGR